MCEAVRRPRRGVEPLLLDGPAIDHAAAERALVDPLERVSHLLQQGFVQLAKAKSSLSPSAATLASAASPGESWTCSRAAARSRAARWESRVSSSAKRCLYSCRFISLSFRGHICGDLAGHAQSRGTTHAPNLHERHADRAVSPQRIPLSVGGIDLIQRRSPTDVFVVAGTCRLPLSRLSL